MATQNSKQYFLLLTVLYFGLLVGQVVFASIALLLNLAHLFQPFNSLKAIFIYIVPVIVVAGFVAGQLVYKNQLNKIKGYDSLVTKMVGYRTALIIKLAMLEGASLFAIIAYLLTSDLIFLGMSGIIIFYFLLMKPSRDKIVMDLGLNPVERMKIEDDNALIAEIQYES
jgi:hypothetical protein